MNQITEKISDCKKYTFEVKRKSVSFSLRIRHSAVMKFLKLHWRFANEWKIRFNAMFTVKT